MRNAVRSPGTASVCFSLVIINDVDVKFKEGSGLKATGIYVILLSQDGFESNSSEIQSQKSLPKVTSEAAVRRCSEK